MISAKAVKGIISAITKKFPKNIQTKLKNINKAGGRCEVCPTKRVSQNSRILLSYQIIRACELTLDQLKTHTSGIVIDVPFREYEPCNDPNNRQPFPFRPCPLEVPTRFDDRWNMDHHGEDQNLHPTL